ncbi:MAG: signal peptidase II [Candidatus Zixiibacteriota bacterium]
MTSLNPRETGQTTPNRPLVDRLQTSTTPEAQPDSSGRRIYLWIAAIVALSVAALDQATKLWAVRALQDQPPLPALGDFLRFTLVYNEGGAMGTNFGGSVYYLIIGILILGVILYYLWLYRFSLRYTIPLSLISAGAVGNLIDRIRLGMVIDWIDVDFIDLNLFGYELERWWTFNVADASISLALVYIIWAAFTAPSSKADLTGPESAVEGPGIAQGKLTGSRSVSQSGEGP